MERLFFAVAGALLLAITAIVAAAGYCQFRGVARTVDRDALDAGQAVQGELLRLRSEALQQVTSAIAANAALVAYINRALAADGSADVRSIQDQLDARRDVLGLDILAILLPSGHLVAGTGKDMPQIHEFGRDDRFIQASRTVGTTTGMWSANEQTWQVAFSPMVQGGSEVAMLLAGRRHDARVAREIAGTSRADYALVVHSESGPVLAASSLDADVAATLAKALRAHPEWMAEAAHAAANAQLPLALGAFEPALRVHALADTGVSWLTIAPVARVDTRARAVTVPLLFALAAVLLVLVAALWWIWQNWVSPLLALARVADHLAVGDYSLAFEPRGAQPVRHIGNALNRAQAQLGRYRPAPGAPRRRNTDRT
jgi:HAMP domain-containing protein